MRKKKRLPILLLPVILLVISCLSSCQDETPLIVKKENPKISNFFPKEEADTLDSSINGKVEQWQKATVGNGVDLVFMGDGFADSSMIKGGKYQLIMREAIEHFFSIEPTKSFRNYFNVYVVYCVSSLGVTLGKGTLITGNNDKCVSYARRAPIRNEKDLIITVVVNSEKWAGTCYTYSHGPSIAYISYTSHSKFGRLITHESIGHGLGKLYDEYINFKDSIPDNKRKKIIQDYNLYGWNANIDVVNDVDQLKWKHFINHPQYAYVGAYEGAALYAKGVWRPEKHSCMINNIPYFNAPSREEIVKRIKKIAGEPYSWDEFAANDHTTPPSDMSKRSSELDEPLTPPIIIIGKPN